MRYPPKKLTELGLDAIKPAAKGDRNEYPDSLFRGLALRVTDTGKKTFVLIARFPASKNPLNPTRRSIGEYPTISLQHARETAKQWMLLLKRGLDPKEEEDRIRLENARKRANTFKSVVEDYLADMPNRKRNRHAEQDEREIRRELIERTDKKGNVWKNPWLSKPVADITDSDVAELIGTIRDGKNRDKPAPGQAYNCWGHIKAIFAWAMWPERRQGYGLITNPVAHLQPKHFRLSKTSSTRVLSDAEVRAYWVAADKTPYPLGPFFKLLMLTGQRKNEVAGAQHSEISQNRRLWTVPSERFKTGQDHIVPLSSDALSLIGDLPRWKGKDAGDCLFSTTEGKKPINGFSNAKDALDTAMLAALKEENPKAILPDWVFHDVRRTVRTRLSALRVNSEIAEMVIGHGKTGIERVYNHHEYEDEMRDALEKWARLLHTIVEPAPDNVIPMVKRDAG